MGLNLAHTNVYDMFLLEVAYRAFVPGVTILEAKHTNQSINQSINQSTEYMKQHFKELIKSLSIFVLFIIGALCCWYNLKQFISEQ